MLVSLFRKYKGELVYLSSTFLHPAIGFLSALLAAKFITPMDNGLIESYLLFLPYLALLQMGTFNGLNRNISFYLAQKKPKKVDLFVSSSKFVALAVGMVSILIICFYLFFFKWNSTNTTLDYLAGFMLLVMGVVNPFTIFLDTTFRSGQQFNELGIIKLKETFGFILTIPLIIFLGGVGKAIGQTFRSILGVLLRNLKAPFKILAKFHRKENNELVKVGFPLMVGGYLWGIFAISDRTIILNNLGKESLGFYFLSQVVLMMMYMVPSSITTVLYPKASYLFGLNKRIADLRPFFWKSLILNVAILIVMAIGISVVLDFVVPKFLPDYLPGLPAAKRSVYTGVTFVMFGPSIITGVVKRNIPIVVLVFVSFIVFYISSWILPITSLEQVADMRLYISMCLCLCSISYSYYLTFTEYVED